MISKILRKLIKNEIDVSKNIKYPTYSCFHFLDDIHMAYYKLNRFNKLPEKETKLLNFEIESATQGLHRELLKLYSYEITLETFKMCNLTDEQLMILENAYAFNHEDFDRKKCRSKYRLLPMPNPYISKAGAKKKFEEYVKVWTSDFSFPAKALFGKQINASAEELVYKYRDWMINEFDKYIDIIEPLRHEYIITRKGDVNPKEADAYLDSIIKADEELYTIFKSYEIYEFLLESRIVTDFMYYPDMKF